MVQRGLHNGAALPTSGGSGEPRSSLGKGCPGRGNQGPERGEFSVQEVGGGGLRAEVAAYSAAGVTESGEWLGLSHQRWDLGRRNANPCLLLGSAPCLARSRGSHPGLVLLSFSGAWLCVVCGEPPHPSEPLTSGQRASLFCLEAAVVGGPLLGSPSERAGRGGATPRFHPRYPDTCSTYSGGNPRLRAEGQGLVGV